MSASQRPGGLLPNPYGLKTTRKARPFSVQGLGLHILSTAAFDNKFSQAPFSPSRLLIVIRQVLFKPRSGNKGSRRVAHLPANIDGGGRSTRVHTHARSLSLSEARQSKTHAQTQVRLRLAW